MIEKKNCQGKMSQVKTENRMESSATLGRIKYNKGLKLNKINYFRLGPATLRYQELFDFYCECRYDIE